jgi:hypothetical protein
MLSRVHCASPSGGVQPAEEEAPKPVKVVHAGEEDLNPLGDGKPVDLPPPDGALR